MSKTLSNITNISQQLSSVFPASVLTLAHLMLLVCYSEEEKKSVYSEHHAQTAWTGLGLKYSQQNCCHSSVHITQLIET